MVAHTPTARYAPGLEPLLRPISELKQDPDNARAHDERNLAAIRESLSRFGLQKPIVVAPDGTVLAGNGTLAAATSLGWTHIACVTTDLAGLDARAQRDARVRARTGVQQRRHAVLEQSVEHGLMHRRVRRKVNMQIDESGHDVSSGEIVDCCFRRNHDDVARTDPGDPAIGDQNRLMVNGRRTGPIDNADVDKGMGRRLTRSVHCARCGKNEWRKNRK